MRVLTQSMLAVDDPQHRRLRQFADQAFHARSIEPMRDRITILADRLLNQSATKGDSECRFAIPDTELQWTKRASVRASVWAGVRALRSLPLQTG